ncbi:hypothetical protein QWY28_23380, partial [Nocardioides sp. SOB77]
LVGLFDDPDSSLTELPVVLLPLLWHLDPHCRCLYGPGGTSVAGTSMVAVVATATTARAKLRFISNLLSEGLLALHS